mgnify:CR=1 FL=1
MAKVIAFNKPFGVICQFSGEGDTLANYVNIPDIYPVGRLDKDSEGLVILTDDGYLQNRVSDPKYKKIKTYKKTYQIYGTNKSYVWVGLLGQPILGRPHEKCIFWRVCRFVYIF